MGKITKNARSGSGKNISSKTASCNSEQLSIPKEKNAAVMVVAIGVILFFFRSSPSVSRGGVSSESSLSRAEASWSRPEGACAEYEGAGFPAVPGNLQTVSYKASSYFTGYNKDLEPALPWLRRAWLLAPHDTMIAANYQMALKHMQLVRLGVCVLRTTRSLWPKGNEASLSPFEVMQRFRVMQQLMEDLQTNTKAYALDGLLKGEIDRMLQHAQLLGRLHPKASHEGLHDTPTWMDSFMWMHYANIVHRRELKTAALQLNTSMPEHFKMLADLERVHGRAKLHKELTNLPYQWTVKLKDLPHMRRRPRADEESVHWPASLAVQLVRKNPSVFIIDNFISASEAQSLRRLQLRNMAEPRPKPDICIPRHSFGLHDVVITNKETPLNLRRGKGIYNKHMCVTFDQRREWDEFRRVTKAHHRVTIAWAGDSGLVDRLDKRIEEFSGLESKFSGNTQLLYYNRSDVGDTFSPNTDCGTNPVHIPTVAWTFLLYLNTPNPQNPAEGAHRFPLLNLTIPARKGRAVIVQATDHDTNLCDIRSIHVDAAVRENEKFMIQKWYMQSGHHSSPETKANWFNKNRFKITCDHEGKTCNTFEHLQTHIAADFGS